MNRAFFTPLFFGLTAAFGCSSSSGPDGAGSAAGSTSHPGGGQTSTGGAGNTAGAGNNTSSGGTHSSAGSGNSAGSSNTAGSTMTGTAGSNPGGGGNTGSAGSTGAAGSGAAGGPAAGAGGGLGAFTGIDFGATSDGGTVTFQNIGKAGSYQSTCPPTGNQCCQQTKTITSDKLTPWDEDLIMTLRGPLDIKQYAVYQPTTEGQPSAWQQVSGWDVRNQAAAKGIKFAGTSAPSTSTFSGSVGSACLVNAMTDKPYGCGPTSNPYCSSDAGNKFQNLGWAGSKMFIVLASAPHVDAGAIKTAQSCAPTTDNWNDAPWFGLSVGELIREGAFSSCNCYGGNSGMGCGQINALETINDNDKSGNYKNLEIFSSNFFSYGGDFGGPCGTNNCNTTGIPANVDLIQQGNKAATMGALGSQTPTKSPSAYIRRPTTGFRYFVFLFDVSSRTIQYALIHPQKVPASLAGLLPSLPDQVPQSTIDAMLALRLPQ